MRFVRADDDAQSSQQPSFEGFAEYVGSDAQQPPPPSVAGPSCRAPVSGAPQSGLDGLLAAQMGAIRAARTTRPAADPDVIVLNGRGYNYGLAPQVPDGARLQRAPKNPKR